MRLRNIPGSRDVIAESEFVVHEFKEAKGKWNEVFENDNPIRIEVGMGKGRFIYDLAKMNPNINYVGIEKFSSVLLRAIQKQEEEPLPNLKFIRMEAEEIADVFAENEVDLIYLNFSDPWPKDRHAKRRLTSRQFLGRYNSFLKKDGVIEFKTDNRDLFMFSLDEVKEAGWEIKAVSYNLHADPVMNEGNVMTEYEERFSSMGNPIYKYVISR